VDAVISKQELRREARIRKLSLDLIEKDYVLGLVLHAIFSSQFSSKISFKGGTALSKIYFPGSWRLSEDLDFTMTEGLGLEQLEIAKFLKYRLYCKKFPVCSPGFSEEFTQTRITFNSSFNTKGRLAGTR
jgi:predicted nucleotidyltransferase component of viral defense system